jgi:hypothetical protein
MIFKTKTRFIWICAALVLITGCKSKSVFSDTTRSETVRLEQKTVTLPGVDLKVIWPGSLAVDSVNQYDTIYKEDPRTGAMLKLYRDKYNRLVAEAQTPDTVVVFKTREKVVYKSEGKTTEKTKNRWWMDVIFIAVGLIILLFLLNRFLPKF